MCFGEDRHFPLFSLGVGLYEITSAFIEQFSGVFYFHY